MKRLLKLVLALLLGMTCASAEAEDWDGCEPDSWLEASATGSPMLWDFDSKAFWMVWWCKVPPGPTDDPTKQYIKLYSWVGMWKYSADAGRAASDRIFKATDHWTQAKTERDSGKFAPPKGSVDECEFQNRQKTACFVLYTHRTLGWWNGVDSATATTSCGATIDCNALPPPVVTWRTPAKSSLPGNLSQLYKVVGSSRAIEAGKTMPPLTSCDCTLKQQIYNPIPTTTIYFCALAGGTSEEVAQCEKAP